MWRMLKTSAAAHIHPRNLGQLIQSRRRSFWVAVTVVSLTVYFLTHTGRTQFKRYAPTLSGIVDTDYPPDYTKLFEWEYNLPQHNLSLPFPEGKTGRYVVFKNQIQMLGYNNQLNEILMNTLLAYKSKRAYVWQDFYWNFKHYPWPEHKFKERLPRTPLNALIAGPSAGGPWAPGDDAPRSVSEAWYNVVCPRNEVKLLNTRDIKPAVWFADGKVIFEHWQKVLTDAPERCIEIHGADFSEDGNPQVFDLFLWGGDRVLSLWEDFKNSPVSRLLATSPLVQAAVDKNKFLFMPRGPRPPVPASNNPFDRMLAIHLRRGDFKEACLGFANWNSTFYSWDLLPELPDPFINPPAPNYEWGKNEPQNIEYYMERCYPDDQTILQKVKTAREEYIRAAKPGESRYLDVLFILSNDKTGWVDGLKTNFKDDGWHTIVTTRDLDMSQTEKDIAMAVDMDLARLAAVFIGNGWSSFTSNIVHRRLVDGKEPISIRFF